MEMTAKLPEGTEIDIRRSKLEGGSYNKETNTIKWTKEIEEINTFAHEENNDTTVPDENGTYEDGKYK